MEPDSESDDHQQQQQQQQQQPRRKQQSRQRPGSACEECRRRKLRCDRRSPQCSVCADANIVCITNPTRAPRGPKKGHLCQLQERIAALEEVLAATLEEVLVEKQNGHLPDDPPTAMEEDSQATTTAISTTSSTSPEVACPVAGTDTLPALQDTTLELTSGIDSMCDLDLTVAEAAASLPFLSTDLPTLMREELDQVYFDRVHAFVPIIHQAYYFVWNRQQSKSETKSALQYAMWTLAASFSVQFQQIGESLYHDTRHMLEMLDLKGTTAEPIEIEQVQAWILLAIYEFTRSCYRRGWMRAGHAFRLVQLMKLYELDTAANNTADWVEVEMKRRTFWMAYCMDRFASIRNGCPLTLSEHVITTRLPAPDADFQGCQPVTMEFLSDAICSNGPARDSPFTECVIITTICGRALTHQQQTSVENTYLSMEQRFQDRHDWISATLAQRMQILATMTRMPPENIDPTLLFTRMLAQTTILYLYKTRELMCLPDGGEGDMADYNAAALTAAQQMVYLAKNLAQLNYFKVHPFTPIPLGLFANFFNTYRGPNVFFDVQIQDIVQPLRNLKSVNSLADGFLQIVNFDSLSTPSTTSTTNSVA